MKEQEIKSELVKNNFCSFNEKVNVRFPKKGRLTLEIFKRMNACSTLSLSFIVYEIVI